MLKFILLDSECLKSKNRNQLFYGPQILRDATEFVRESEALPIHGWKRGFEFSLATKT